MCTKISSEVISYLNNKCNDDAYLSLFFTHLESYSFWNGNVFVKLENKYIVFEVIIENLPYEQLKEKRIEFKKILKEKLIELNASKNIIKNFVLRTTWYKKMNLED
jgi:hypothetical protein